MGPDDNGGGGTVWCAYRSGSASYVDNLRGYVSEPPSVHTHPGKGQCALCGRWFCRRIMDTSVRGSCQQKMTRSGVKMMRFTKMIAPVFEARYLL